MGRPPVRAPKFSRWQLRFISGFPPTPIRSAGTRRYCSPACARTCPAGWGNVWRALAPIPAERYADAGEFALALQAGLVGGEEDNGALAKPFPLSRLQIWQALTFFFAAGFLFLLLRDFK